MNEVSFEEPGSPDQCFLIWCGRDVTVAFNLGGNGPRYSCENHQKKFLKGNAAVAIIDIPDGDTPVTPTLDSAPVDLPNEEE